jgi:hypothetical protein
MAQPRPTSRGFRIAEPNHVHRPRRSLPHLGSELHELGEEDVAESVTFMLHEPYRSIVLGRAPRPDPTPTEEETECPTE